MADNNKLELVVEVDVNKANASIKSVNTGLSGMEQAAAKDWTKEWTLGAVDAKTLQSKVALENAKTGVETA